MFVGESLFECARASDPIYKLVLDGNYDKFWEKVNKNGTNIPTDLKHMIEKMICSNPKERLPLKDIIGHKWLSF